MGSMIVGWLVVAGVVLFFVWAVRRGKRAGEPKRAEGARDPSPAPGPSPVPAMVCTRCGFQGRARRTTRGSFLVELVLWLCMIVPGLFYSLWRLTTRYDACPACRGATMIPAATPAGRRLVAG